jgi:L-amino acid N-acyltransferase YncA
VLAEGERAVRERLDVRVVLAAVHQDNAASAALFDHAGYAEAAPAVSGFRQLRKTLG